MRLFNCTGPRKKGDISSDFALRAVQCVKTKCFTMKVGNLSAHRAILDVRDLCNGLFILYEKGVPGEAYNICSSHIFQMTHIVECLEKIINHKISTIQDQTLLRPADEKLYAGDCTKIKKLGWKECRNYYDTLKDIYNYYYNK